MSGNIQQPFERVATLPEWGVRSPVQWPQWYAAAGWSDRAELLTSGRAAVTGWRVRVGEHSFHDPVALLAGEAALTGPATAALHRGALVTVSPYGYRGGALSDVDTPQRDLERLADRLVARGRELGVALVLSHYLYAEQDAGWLAALRSAGGLPVVLGADAVLDLRWSDLSDYYRWLGPSRRAQRVEARALSAEDLVWQRHEQAEPPPDRQWLVRLLSDHAGRFDRKDPPPDRLFESLVAGSDLPRTLLTVGPRDEPPRSVLLVLRAGKVLYAKSFGTRAPRTDYFSLVYPALLRYAMDTGARRIEYGGGSHQAKLLRGCRLRVGFGALFVLDERLRAVIEPLAREVGRCRRDYFTALARNFQHASLPLDGGEVPSTREGTKNGVLSH